MDRFRNMEVVLMLCFGVLCAAVCVLDPSLRPRAVPAIAAASGTEVVEPPMAVVVITGKRLTPAQKRAEIEADARRAG